jgi:hypothetical protein
MEMWILLRGDFFRGSIGCGLPVRVPHAGNSDRNQHFSSAHHARDQVRADGRLSKRVSIGSTCHIASIHLDRNVLVGAGVHIPSGQNMHGTSQIKVGDSARFVRLLRIGQKTAWAANNMPAADSEALTRA